MGGQAADLRWGSGQAVLLVTTDGGSSWAQHPLPEGVGAITDVSCPSSLHCVALAATGTTINGRESYDGAERFLPTTVLVTNDAGRTWAQGSYPTQPAGATYDVVFVACPTVTRCYFSVTRSQIVDDLDGSYTQTDTAELVLVSRDGGRTLTVAMSPGSGYLSALSCPDASDCMAVTSGVDPSSIWSSHDGARTWTDTSLQGPASQIEGVNCANNRSCIGTAPTASFASDDFGLHWTPIPTAGTIDDVSCSHSARCVGLQETSRGDRPASNY